MEVNKPTIKTMHIDKVTPYWRNPRRIPAEAVQAVKQSLDSFGYLQPVVVDENNVIVIGHTRYAALRKLDVEKIPVVVVDYLSPEQIKQLRVVDNRTNEYTMWDFDKLVSELESMGTHLAEADAMLMFGLFPELTDTLAEGETVPGAESVVDADNEWRYVVPEVDFVCPSCFHEWEQTVTREQIMAGRIEQEK